ncbi:MAG: hypothetical protein H5T96_09760, partial [Tissierellales bacterium]|nr:hypothetical protein [Tissierellales bacterium]
DETFPIIAEKENFTIEKCEGDVIINWDDDDLAMPNNLYNINKYWKDDTNLLHWNKALFYNGPNATKIAGVGNSGIAFSKKVWEEIGRTPVEQAGWDMSFVVKIHNLGRDKVVLASPPDEEVSWVYRWGGIPAKSNEAGIYHQSGQGTDTPDRKNIVQRHVEYIEQQRKHGKIPTGDIELKPHAVHDYVDLRRRTALQNRKK